jgi:hypothetical protein
MTVRTVHFVAAILATITIARLFASTALVEAFGTHGAVARLKSLVVMPGLFILVPAIAATGGTGFALSRGWQARLVRGWQGRLVGRKKRRMPLIAANGLLVLMPAAILLDRWASAGAFDARFYVVQAVEHLAGATNLVLMGLNVRDGLVLSGRIRRGQPIPSPR